MQATEAAYSMSSPPFIIDSDMSGRLESEPELDFFDSSLTHEPVTSPSLFLADEFATDNHHLFGSPSNFKSPLPTPPFIDTIASHRLSAPSSHSPAGSYQDSSSDSSVYKRKSSSDSSRSAITSGDVMMADDTDMQDWKMDALLKNGTDAPGFGGYHGNGTIDPSSIGNNFGFSDKSMENDFDFESAASSPSCYNRVSMDVESPDMPTIKYDAPRRKSPMLKNKFNRNHNKANSQHSITQSMNGLTTTGSREASPLSAMVTSQESSPSAFFNHSPSPGTGVEFVNGRMINGAGPPSNQAWSGNFDFSMNAPHGHPMVNNPAVPAAYPMGETPLIPTLIIHPTPLKSRVETQIPIKMSLFPLPLGINKLHLPTHTISKPKLLAKPTPEKSPDTLELSTMLVCTSAMLDPEKRKRAFARAALSEAQRESPPPVQEDDEDDVNRPVNGGEVKICPGCITRERKRAARKKIKKVEEEESWHKDELRRVIVFNTHEIKDWQPPSPQPPSDGTGDRQDPIVPNGAFQVDAPMRIACYCRHQNEKMGFQVIFTIKDHQDHVIAQEITSSIMITDDHKTHNMPTLSTQASNASDGQPLPGATSVLAEGAFDMPTGPVGGMAPFRISHSSSDLQTLQGNFPNPYQPSLPTSAATTSSFPSQNTSATMTPRNLSRQASPSANNGPSSKKRKASGSGKVPTGLAMTKLETTQASICTSAPPASVASSTAASPFTPNLQNFPLPNDQQFGQPLSSFSHMPPQYNTGPPTPNSNDQFFSHTNRSQSMDNLAMHQLYSAPVSAHPSRAPSPNGLRNSVAAYQQQQQAHIAQAVANGLFSMPLSLNPHRQPTIHKLIPNEGPKAGGIEVTCLGSGFSQGLEVMFGDTKATTTTFWGETSLVCLLPPAVLAGTVAVTFKHQHQQMQPYPAHIPKQQAFFKYVDDDEQQLIRTALTVLHHKMTGKMEDVHDLARRIIGDGPSSWSSPTGPSSSQNQQVSGFSAATFGVDVEATLLRCLDLIDLDDSPNMPRWNLRRSSGQTMLHLACSLGLNRFVAALLARGANPEPRDKGGFTPMHFAALHSQPQIVRRLILSGADPTVRSLQGFTAADMASSDEVLRATRRLQHHSRTRSGSSLRSRTSSATSLRSFWEPESSLGGSQIDNHSLLLDSDDDDIEYEDEDADAATDGAFWMRSRRPSAQKTLARAASPKPSARLEVAGPVALPSPTAAMTAFRDQLTAQIQQFQQSMHLNLPNLPQMPQIPNLPQMPTLNAYQNYLPTPMARRISSMAGGSGDGRPDPGREQEHRWWDLFSSTAAPPAYEEIFPQSEVDTKHASAAQAAADTVADNKCAEIFDQAESSTEAQKRKSAVEKVTIGVKHTLTKEQHDQLLVMHAERKAKKMANDRKLFFVWIPLLLVVILATLYYRVPKAWTGAAHFFKSVRDHNNALGRLVGSV